ncbi:MAG: LysM peptidoglycan-binding domain-containing protein [Haloechinothrix sp.]
MASREPLIEPYRPYEPEHPHDVEYEYDYDVDPDRPPARAERPRVLWGRVAILGGAILLAFLIGRSSAPGGIPESDLRAARADIAAAETEADQLRDQIATLEQEVQGLDEEKAGDNETAGDEEAEGGGGSASENQTYTVKSGDTLSTIAERFYGNAALDDFIAAANPGVDPYALHVGQELVIPPKPEG